MLSYADVSADHAVDCMIRSRICEWDEIIWFNSVHQSKTLMKLYWYKNVLLMISFTIKLVHKKMRGMQSNNLASKSDL